MRDCFSTTSMLTSFSIAAAIFAPSASLACGYEDDVSIARGALNWVYPDALHVVGAISAAVAERHLPAPNFDAVAPDLFGSKYSKTAQSLEKLAAVLNAAQGEAPAFSFSLVLVEPVLWTRFEADEGQLHARIHVTGPQQGDLVLVSGEAVVGEISSARLTIGEARKRGFIRLYGSEAQRAEFIDTYELIRTEPSEDLDRMHSQSSLDSGGSQQAARHLKRSLPATAMATGAVRLPASEGRSAIACNPEPQWGQSIQRRKDR